MPKGLPLVAVVTPVLNGAPWIERTLASVQRQTYRNIVHVILDNASTDETPRMIENARGGPAPLQVRRNERQLRQTENWNAAMALVPPEAKYVKWLCADDLMAPDCIEKMVRLAESDEEIDLVLAVDVVGRRTCGDRLDAPKQVYAGPDIARAFMTGRMRHLPAAHMFFRVDRELMRNPFDDTAQPAMDADFLVRELMNRKVGYIFEPLLFTRVTSETHTMQQGGFRASVLPGLSRLSRYGLRVMSPEQYKSARRRERRKLTRHALAWIASRDANGQRALAALRAEGVELSFIDYAVAVASWPAHKVRREMDRLGQAAPNANGRSEQDFLDEQQPPPPPPPPASSGKAATA